jgi:hypothetical protein
VVFLQHPLKKRGSSATWLRVIIDRLRNVGECLYHWSKASQRKRILLATVL